MLFLDILCAYIFYKLSIPNKKSSAQGAKAYDWAGYLCLIFIAVTVFEFIDLLLIADINAKYVWSALFILFCAVLVLGFFRGFGMLAGFAFAGGLALFAALAGNLFSLTINLMMIAAYGLVIFFSIPPIRTNLRAWANALKRARKPDDDQNRSRITASEKVSKQMSKAVRIFKISDQ